MKDKKKKKALAGISAIGKRFKATEKTHRFSLSLIFGMFVFAVLLIAMAFAVFAVWLLGKLGVITGGLEDSGMTFIVLLISVISIIIGSGMSLLLGKIPLKPINDLVNHMNRLAAGDFSARLKFSGAWKSYPAFDEMSASFNKLAEELENTEMLRGDFINNFSHEFKTPIVSIAGLAKLVNKGNLTEEQRARYLTAIEEESLRLASMATNVLNLTKVENQTILSDMSVYNLSEQIRSCVLLLENKWSHKNLELALDFDEHEIEANEELLKEVWINLLDNAVKFSPRCGTVSVSIEESIGKISVTVSNTGSEISEENQRKIWNKFYQADESHASEGNGVGLAIVKRVVELHGGAIFVKSGDGITSFTVDLPGI
ncbi:MAG: HAMP domain-containing histidine kinase [Clostridia bacterium]|nr:HAMP domain-containing histidine kinase [Clostridia bacterium]